MSEASRAAALQHAAAVHHGSGDSLAVLQTAELFHAFVTGEPVSNAAPPKVAKAAKTAAPKTAPKAAEPEEAASDEVTKEQVGEAIEAMLNANLRNEAIKLFAKYKARSLSGVDSANYAALLQDANDALLSA
jgi:hypothetical protein